MKELVRVEQLIHGESALPGWAIGVLALIGIVLVVRWVHAHHGKGIAGKLLYVTGPVIVLLLAWLIWRPTLVVINHWRVPTQAVTYVDRSGSMASPLVGQGDAAVTALLDLLPAEMTADRITVPGEFDGLLTDDIASLALLADQLAIRLDLYDQGLPPGEVLADVSARYADMIARLREAWPSFAIDVRNAAYGDADGAATPRTLGDALEAMLTALDRTPPTVNTDERTSIERAARAIDAVHAAAEPVLPMLRSRQRELDTAWLTAQNQAVTQAVEALRVRTRADAVAEIAASLPTEDSAASTGTAVDQHARLLDHVAAQLDAVRGEPVADLVIVSDGASESSIDAAVVDRVVKAGLRVTVIGAGLPERSPDAAIVDWVIPRVVRAGRETSLAVTLKVPEAGDAPITVVADANGEELARHVVSAEEKLNRRAVLRFDAPDKGRHRIALRIDEADANPQNNAVHFSLDTVSPDPDVVLIGDMADWDTAYFYLAMRRLGFDARQVFHAGSDEPPRRGGSSSSIPSTDSQWSRNEVVVLKGRVFQDFADEDADALRTYVASGGSLVVMTGGDGGYVNVLADWLAGEQVGAATGDSRVTLAAGADGRALALPMMRLDTDAAATRARLSTLSRAGSLTAVPPQHISLFTDSAGVPVASLGFYGRGKVYLWGVSGLAGMAEYGDTRWVDRLIEQLLADAAAPIWIDEKDTSPATYPSLPRTGDGAVNVALSLQEDGTVDVQRVADDAVAAANAVRNPSAEQVFYEFNEAFLRDVADRMNGKYVALQDAPFWLAELEPATFDTATAERYPLASSMWILVAITVFGTLHWTLRKLAGVAI